MSILAPTTLTVRDPASASSLISNAGAPVTSDEVDVSEYASMTLQVAGSSLGAFELRLYTRRQQGYPAAQLAAVNELTGERVTAITSTGLYRLNTQGLPLLFAELVSIASGLLSVYMFANRSSAPLPAPPMPADGAGGLLATTRGRIHATTYDKDNPLTGASSLGNWEIRDTDVHSYNFNVAADGIFDHSLWIRSTLDADVRIFVIPQFHAGGSYRSGPTFYQGADALTLAANSSLCLCPQIPQGMALTSGQRIVVAGDVRMVQLELMREPTDRLVVQLVAQTEPTTGEVQFRHIVRE